ncbi:MAG: hypothetical protein PHQ36_07490 [Anaerolineales bacterium]|nr:hypothetical protein [Anaerolineales bacterium]
MKRLFFLGCLVLIVSCQSIAPTPQVESTPPVAATIPPTETAAPTVTASPTVTPIPFYFTDEFNADLGAWTFFQTGGAQSPTAALENDSLNINLTSPDLWYYAIHTAHEYTGVFVSAKFSASPGGSVGLVCDYSETNGWYEYNVASDGTYSILFGQWLAEGIAQYKPIADNATEYLKAGNLNYEIGLTCKDDVLLLHINGKMFRKIDVARFELTQGKVGVTASSFDDVPMNALFEWVKVAPPQ